ncbi:MAG: hypothetical protein M3336_04060 [Chloroflexota bacterium]|nr:hypothetical protein [Chloroflexota bacterium]
MSRLRYPFTEISARCRLCGAVGLTASSEHALGGRLIDWRRAHAPVCPEWPRWAARKGLRLDERGALLYPNEEGPYEPRVRARGDDGDDAEEEEFEAEPEPPRIDLMRVPAEQLEQAELF